MELERRLREEICGPAGDAIAGRGPFTDLMDFQLPRYAQFVYADLEQKQIEKVKSSWPNRVAGERTATFAHNILPTQHSYKDVAYSLRGLAEPSVWQGWLPGVEGEPDISPLLNGAGQLPTVARVALFETLRQNARDGRTLSGWNAALRKAFAELSLSRGAITAQGGPPPQDVIDVFVAFSVAGGTGCGLFYDFLHFVAEAALTLPTWAIRLYPLVVMPSAFEGSGGGGKKAELNGGHALLDLFRLVDACNRGQSPEMLYPPGDFPLQIQSGLRTAFLFSATAGLSREDLHRSIVTLILSLVGTALDEVEGADAAAEGPGSFADRFINSHADLGQPSATGIGNRSVSTAAVASLTIPHERITNVLVDRFLAKALKQLEAPPAEEANSDARRQTVTAIGVDEVLNREAPPVMTIDNTLRGAVAIHQALHTQGTIRVRALETLSQQLRTRQFRFDWTRGVETLLQSMDLFRAHRVIFGDTSLKEERDQTGVIGLFERLAASPTPPQDGMGPEPPPLPPLSDGLAGARKLKWSQPPVPTLVDTQEQWYKWRAQRAWSAAWARAKPDWGQVVTDMRDQLGAIVDALGRFAANEPDAFRNSCSELYKSRQGIKFLLPDAGPDLGNFYQKLLVRLRERYSLDPAREEHDVLAAMLGVDGWREAFAEAVKQADPMVALATLREKAVVVVKDALAGGDHRPPLLPKLLDLLEDASDQREGHMLTAALGSLLPGGFEPQGRSGQSQTQVSYPANAKGGRVEAFLRESLGQQFADPTVKFAITTSDAVAVILSKHAMGITDVEELQQLVRKWNSARLSPKSQDLLKWRQRLGYDPDWVLTTEDDRIRILHRILNALWDGRVKIAGDPASPTALSIVLRDGAIPIDLRLEPFRTFSSWPGLLAAYERFVIQADGTQLESTGALMEYLPSGLGSEIGKPSDAYCHFVAVAREQPKLIESELDTLADVALVRARHLLRFWCELLEASFAMPFELENRAYRNHAELQEKFGL
jgi:hypothetical protein